MMINFRHILKRIFPKKTEKTPQNQPLPGQIPNSAGGYYYQIDDWAQLDRFLILGTESGTYYVDPLELTEENTKSVQAIIATHGLRAVERIAEVSHNGRAPKNDAILFALALAAAAVDPQTRKAALAALPKVARTGTHLLMFAEFVLRLRGWGRGLRSGIGRWFLDMPVEKLSLQAVKYSQREGWALRDLLRLTHPKAMEVDRAVLLDWITHPEKPEAIASARQAFRLVEGKCGAKEAQHANQVAEIIKRYSLPREAVPTEHLQSKEVWDALLVDMPLTAMIRNLGKMSQIGLLEPFSEASKYVANRLLDEEQLKKARIHPIQLLLALRIYSKGQGEFGSLRWTPVPLVIQALNDGFDRAFTQIKPTNKRILVGVDVSGSMSCQCIGSPVLKSVEAAMAMAMLFVRTEENVHAISFDTATYELPITQKQRLDDILTSFYHHGGGTDLSLTITYALKKKLNLDAFLVVTDNETWAGKEHPEQALYQYRQKINPHAKLVVMATAANKGSIVNPNDPFSLGVAGFDASAPQLVADFIRGEL